MKFDRPTPVEEPGRSQRQYPVRRPRERWLSASERQESQPEIRERRGRPRAACYTLAVFAEEF
jgi:hypothetical protein